MAIWGIHRQVYISLSYHTVVFLRDRVSCVYSYYLVISNRLLNMSNKTNTPTTILISSSSTRSDHSLNYVMKLLKSMDEKRENGLKKITNKLTVYEKKLADLRNSLDNLVISYNNLQEENDLLKSELNNLRDKVESINSINQNKFDLINKVNDRLSRPRNLLIFNSPEDNVRLNIYHECICIYY